MADLQKEYEQDTWKSALRSEIIIALTGDPIEKENALEKIGYYYECYAPATLYKYYPDTIMHLNSVRNNQMWYSAPCNYNDVFDCDIAIDNKAVFDEALKLFPDSRGIRPGSKVWRDFQKSVNHNLRSLRATFDNLRNTMGVSCLSESEKSLLMWAHYANNHRGICVEYDLLQINSVLKFTAVPVIYSQERACFNFFNPENIENDTLGLFIQSLTSKSLEWSYEKEWRIIRENVACGEKWDTDKKGALLDMLRPCSITLGCAAREEFQKDVTDYCSANRITLYKMKKDPVRYKLNREVLLDFGKEDENE